MGTSVIAEFGHEHLIEATRGTAIEVFDGAVLLELGFAEACFQTSVGACGDLAINEQTKRSSYEY